MERPADVILVDASLDHPLGFSPLGLAAHDTVIVVSPDVPAITDAYALIKKVSLGYARKNFRILVNKVRAQDEAEAIYGNIAQVTAAAGWRVSTMPAMCRSTSICGRHRVCASLSSDCSRTRRPPRRIEPWPATC